MLGTASPDGQLSGFWLGPPGHLFQPGAPLALGVGPSPTPRIPTCTSPRPPCGAQPVLLPGVLRLVPPPVAVDERAASLQRPLWVDGVLGPVQIWQVSPVPLVLSKATPGQPGPQHRTEWGQRL